MLASLGVPPAHPPGAGREGWHPRDCAARGGGGHAGHEGFVGAHPRPTFPLAAATLAGRVPRAGDWKRAPWRVRGRHGCASWERLAEDRYSERAGVARVSAPGRPSTLRSSRLSHAHATADRAPWLGVSQLRAAAGHPALGARVRRCRDGRSREPVRLVQEVGDYLSREKGRSA
jgi:hypothetical protein